MPQQGSSTHHARVGEAVGDVELLAQHGVHAGDHVLHDLRRRVPDPELFAQLGVERLEERLVEVLHGVALLEGAEERGAVDAVERLGGPVEHLVDAHEAERPRVAEVVEELLQDGDVQVAGGLAPAEARLRVGGRMVLGPEDPGGEEAVEQGLDEGGAEEVLALLAREAHAERLFEGLARAHPVGQVALLGAGAGLAGVAGEEPGEVLGRGDLRLAQQHAPQEVGEALAGLPGSIAARVRGERPELRPPRRRG